MMDRAQIGRLGEAMTADYLKSKGFLITRRNYRSKYGEIDIIAESPEYVIFVEVKTRREDFLMAPADAVSRLKQQKIARTALEFLSKLRMDINARFDIAEVIYTMADDGELTFRLNYIRNAFTVEVLNDRPF